MATPRQLQRVGEQRHEPIPLVSSDHHVIDLSHYVAVGLAGGRGAIARREDQGHHNQHIPHRSMLLKETVQVLTLLLCH